MSYDTHYTPFQRWYDGEQNRFHRGQFTPEQIAYAAWIAGMRYGMWLQAHEDAQKPVQDPDEVWRKLW